MDVQRCRMDGRTVQRALDQLREGLMRKAWCFVLVLRYARSQDVKQPRLDVEVLFIPHTVLVALYFCTTDRTRFAIGALGTGRHVSFPQLCLFFNYYINSVLRPYDDTSQAKSPLTDCHDFDKN
jgi:hypothetical protein